MRTFDEFLKQGLIKKMNKDEARARNIVGGAEARKNVMEKYLPLNEETAVKIIEEGYDVIRELLEAKLSKEGYDVIRELLEAKLSKEGYKSYNHEAVISYLAKLGFSMNDVLFVDKLREIRHGTKYYGQEVKLDYAKNVKDFLNEIYSKLKNIASN